MKTDHSSQCAPKPASRRGGETDTNQHTTMLIRGLAGGAQWLSLSEKFVWSLVNRNALPHRRCGRAILFVPDELTAWVQAGCPDEPGAAERVRATMRKGEPR